MSHDPDYVTVRPRQVRLTHRGEALEPRSFNLPSWKSVAIGFVVLGVVAALFLFAPSWVPAPSVERPRASAPTPLPSPGAQPPPANEVEQAPLEQLISERERARAQDTLSRYVELQIRLEDEMHVDAWAKDRYAEIEAIAASGDELFMKRKYDDAMKGYQDAAAGLEALIEDGEARFDAALEQAMAAVADYKLDEARTAVAVAAAIHPDDPQLDVPNKRIGELPRLIELRRTADEMLRDGNEAGARELYRQALALDPASTALKQAVASLDASLAERQFQESLTAGYSALEAGRFADARAAFNRALAQRPGDVGAQQGLEQVAQSDTLDRLQQLRTGATQLEAEESWQEAAAAYDQVLRVDRTLKFAADGKARAADRAELDAAIEDVIGHPERLSSDDTFQKSVALYDRAMAIENPGPRLIRQRDTLKEVIATASSPVPFTLVSDNATLVTISHVGQLGAFAEKRLELRPGRYLVIGSRDGCRDVRKQVDVSANMAPVDIRCEERL